MTAEQDLSTIRYMNDVDGAEVVRRARLAAGLTQEELATLADTSQSAVAAYETGARQPSWSVLQRIVGASGHRIELELRADPAVFRLTDLADQIAMEAEDSVRLRLVFEFLRGAADDGVPLPLLVAAEPRSTGDVRFDALLAAIAEDLCVHGGLRPPSWVHDDERCARWAVVDQRPAVCAGPRRSCTHPRHIGAGAS